METKPPVSSWIPVRSSNVPRDEIAMHAMAAIISKTPVYTNDEAADLYAAVAVGAVMYADALIARLAQTEPVNTKEKQA